MASIDGAGKVIGRVSALLTAVPGIAILSIMALPPPLLTLLQAIVAAAGVAAAILVFMNDARIRDANVGAVTLALSALCVVAIIAALILFRLTETQLMIVPERMDSDGMLVLPLFPSAELQERLLPFGGVHPSGYGEALMNPNAGAAVLQMINSESGVTTLAMSVLALLTQLSLTVAIVAGAVRLAPTLAGNAGAGDVS